MDSLFYYCLLSSILNMAARGILLEPESGSATPLFKTCQWHLIQRKSQSHHYDHMALLIYHLLITSLTCFLRSLFRLCSSHLASLLLFQHGQYCLCLKLSAKICLIHPFISLAQMSLISDTAPPPLPLALPTASVSTELI